MTTIGSEVFSDCNQLNDLILPSGVTSMGSSIFRGVRSTFILDCSNNSNYFLENGLFYKSGKKILLEYFDYGQKSIIVPPECNSISNYVFKGSNIQDIKFSGSSEMKIFSSVFSESKI